MKLFLVIIALFLHVEIFAQNSTAPISNPQVPSIKPTIMLIPFVKEGQDLRGEIESNPAIRTTFTKIAEYFQNRGFQVTNLIAELNNNQDFEVLSSDAKGDFKSKLAGLSKSEINIEVEVKDVSVDEHGASKAFVTLNALDGATSRTMASKVCESNRSRGAFDDLILQAIDKGADIFLNTMQKAFTDIVEHGKPIRVNFNVGKGSKIDFGTILKGEKLPLSDVIDEWLANNSIENNYHLSSSTKLQIIYDEVRIPFKKANGRNFTLNDYGKELLAFFTSKNIAIERLPKGGILLITLQ